MVDGGFYWRGAPGGELVLVAGLGDGAGEAGAESVIACLVDHGVHGALELVNGNGKVQLIEHIARVLCREWQGAIDRSRDGQEKHGRCNR